jgi:ubiquinone/menaquinone biosynthesis C-methylase UbiE
MDEHLFHPIMAAEMNSDYKHCDHFRIIAPLYQNLRITDVKPVTIIAHELQPLPAINAADIGCGTGRYTFLLFEHLREKAPIIHCIDYSTEMIKQLEQYSTEHGFRASSKIQASAMSLPLRNESLNCLFTFNAVHHFGLLEFFHETARILQDGGYLFVYTRLRSQNYRNVWGKFFPLFSSKETRLYELGDLSEAVIKVPSLRLQKTHTFKFIRKSNLENLIKRAQNHHYSTFDLYSPGEFKTALKQFCNNLLDYFNNPDNIQWVDENILLVVRKVCQNRLQAIP